VIYADATGVAALRAAPWHSLHRRVVHFDAVGMEEKSGANFAPEITLKLA
jgi:hypothetical protein